MKRILVAALLGGAAFLQAKSPSFLEISTPWADATIATMTLEEKIAQCFMPAVPVKISDEQIAIVEDYLKRYPLGGVFLDGAGTIEQQVALINRLQKASKVPLLVGQDLEFGPAMRLTDGMQWPFSTTFGAVQDHELVYRAGLAMGRQARALGVHVAAAPVVDINSNPKNPIINIRSFGATREIVIPRALAMIRGLEDGGVLSCIKHFPGHGDTFLDSHKALPVIKHTRQRMFDVELAPFQAAIDEGASVVMTGHLSVPAFDASGTPATLSPLLIQDLLQHTMHFEGLIMTDALVMKALPNVGPLEINLRALQAGHDLLIYADAIPETIQYFVDIMHNPKVSSLDKQAVEQAFTERAHKILKAKEWLGLSCKKLIEPAPAAIAAGTDEYELLAQQIYQAAMSVVRDEQGLIPLADLKHKNVRVVTRGQADPFMQQFKTFKKVDFIPAELGFENYTALLQASDVVVYVYVPPLYMVGGLAARMLAGKLEPQVLSDLDLLYDLNKNVVMVLCASPFLLYSLPAHIPVLVAYESHYGAQVAAVDALCGKNPIVGKLPLILSDTKDHREKDL